MAVRPTHRRAPATAVVAACAALLFAVIGVLAARRPLPDWDRRAVVWALGTSDRFDLPLRATMQLGTTAIGVALAVLTGVVQRSWRRAALVLATVAVAYAATNIAKSAWRRPRPASAYHGIVPRIFVAGHGFPSGHATMAAAVAIAIGAGVRARWWPVLAAGAALTASARVYFGVHFVLDVVGGLVLGLAVGSAVVTLFGAFSGAVAPPADDGRR